MPRNQFQRMIFAFITVVITVHAFVFYNIYVLNGDMLRSFNYTSSVLTAVNKQGGIMMFGKMLPIWAVVLVEFVFAYTLEITLGSPLSFRIASRMFDMKTTNPVIFEGTIITVTVAIMCPAMSFIAAIIYFPFFEGFNLIVLLCHWLKLVCFNLPFAFFSQHLFIQPLVRRIFRFLFRKDIKNKENR
ncbi:MAG: hypothetical protein IJU14_06285 [Clostridia bacterium]|nr:hypothetical protein [Clostridia bacterium]